MIKYIQSFFQKEKNPIYTVYIDNNEEIKNINIYDLCSKCEELHNENKRIIKIIRDNITIFNKDNPDSKSQINKDNITEIYCLDTLLVSKIIYFDPYRTYTIYFGDNTITDNINCIDILDVIKNNNKSIYKIDRSMDAYTIILYRKDKGLWNSEKIISTCKYDVNEQEKYMLKLIK